MEIYHESESMMSRDAEDEALPDERLEFEVDNLVRRLKDDGGSLFILRNQVPDTFLGDSVLYRRGAPPHYCEDEIGKFFSCLLYTSPSPRD